MPKNKLKRHFKYKFKKYLSIFVPSIKSLITICVFAIILSVLYVFKYTGAASTLSLRISGLLNNSLVGYLSTFVLWGLIGFLIYFILFEIFQVGEEIEFDIKEIFTVKWPKGKNPIGPLENTVIRIIFRTIIILLIAMFSLKAVLIISNEFRSVESFWVMALIFIKTLVLSYIEIVLIRLMLLKNRLFNIVK